jgi:hypothetical protein
VLPRKAAAGAERGSLEPGHASLPGLAGRQLAVGTWRPVPAHKSLLVALLTRLTTKTAKPDATTTAASPCRALEPTPVRPAYQAARQQRVFVMGARLTPRKYGNTPVVRRVCRS